MLANVLLPKTRGFGVCLEVLQNSLDAGSFQINFSPVSVVVICF